MRKLSEQKRGKFLIHVNRFTRKTKITCIVIQKYTCNFYGMLDHTTTDNRKLESQSIYSVKKNVLRQTKLQILFLSLTIKIEI